MENARGQFGIFTTDAHLVVRTWDDWVAEASGIPAAAAVGRHVGDVIPSLEPRGLLARLEHVLREGTVEVLAPAFHQYLIPCAPRHASAGGHMVQRVAFGALREGDRVVGVMVTIEDVTERREQERQLAAQLRDRRPVDDAALVSALRDERWQTRRSVARGLATSGDAAAVSALVLALRDEHQDLNVVSSALQLLANGQVDIVAPLVAFLDSPDGDLRIQAALLLGARRDPRSTAALLRALDDADPNVRFHAIEALGRLAAGEATDRLIEIAEREDFFLAYAALDALVRINDSRVAARLIPLLGRDSLRPAAAEALGALGDDTVVVPLVSALDGARPPVVEAALALAHLFDRYQERYQGGEYIAELTRQHFTPTAAQRLLDALDHASGPALRALALVLGWLENAAAHRALTRLLGDPAARPDVVQALVRHGPSVVDPLIEQLSSDDADTRHAAVVALGRIGNRRATAALVRLLGGDRDEIVPAAGALARIGDGAAFEPLVPLLGHEDAGVRQAVIAAINSIGHPDTAARMRALIASDEPRLRESAVKVAGYFGVDECRTPVLNACRDADEIVRRAALEHLPFFEDVPALDVISRALVEDTPRVRASAAQALGRLRDPGARAPLIAALEDEDSWVRYFAAGSLGALGWVDACDRLEVLAREDRAQHVRLAALAALGKLCSESAVAVLASVAAEADDDLAGGAIKALGGVPSADAWPPLQQAMRSSSMTRRLAAVEALARRGGAEAVQLLQWTAAADPEPPVTRAAVDALESLARSDQTCWPEAIDALVALTADASRRPDCITALSAIPPDRAGSVARGLQSASPDVRCATVEALGRMRHVQSSRLVSDALDDAVPLVRHAAVLALAHLGSRVADPKLAQMADTDPDPHVRQAARSACHRRTLHVRHQ